MGDSEKGPRRGTDEPMRGAVGRGWNLDGQPTSAPAADGDSAWTHQVVARDGEVASVRVTIIGAPTDADASVRVREARRTSGRTEVERVMAWVDWRLPPREILFHPASTLPDIQTGEGVWMRAVPIPVG